MLLAQLALGLVLVALLLTGLQVLRRSTIARGGSLVLMAVHQQAGWRTGMARVGIRDICWYPLFGIGTRPGRMWERGLLEVGTPEPTDHRPSAMAHPVLVPFTAGGQRAEIVVSSGDYTALRSWSESAPPGRFMDVA